MARLSIIPGVALAALLACTGAGAGAQVAGTATLAVAKLEVAASGWSVKRQVLGHMVYNENSEEVGRIDDLIVAPDAGVTFVIIGAGGFVGIKRHQVAVPVDELEVDEHRVLLRGATKAAIKALPNFEYAQ